MINITLPDGAVREYPAGTSAADVARSISEGLARKVLAAEVNGEVWDSSRPINSDATLRLLMWDDKNGKATFWHSSAHLMAEALEAIYWDRAEAMRRAAVAAEAMAGLNWAAQIAKVMAAIEP